MESSSEQTLIRTREQAFLSASREMSVQAPVDPALAPPVEPAEGLPVVRGLPQAAVVRASIAKHGSLLVRGLLSHTLTVRLREAAQSALAARKAFLSGGPPPAPEWHSEFPRLRQLMSRAVTGHDGTLAVDSPRGLAQLLEVFEQSGISDLARGVLGSVVAFAAEKTVFREVSPRSDELREKYADYGWHQDGAFLGEHIRTLDVWIALTACGRAAPGLEVVAHRLDGLIPGGALADWDLSGPLIDAAIQGFRSVRPEFEPGDGILFDQLCIHRTSHLPGMTEKRLGIECWTFAVSSVPAMYAGLML